MDFNVAVEISAVNNFVLEVTDVFTLDACRIFPSGFDVI